jgi:hypothetical protein
VYVREIRFLIVSNDYVDISGYFGLDVLLVLILQHDIPLVD